MTYSVKEQSGRYLVVEKDTDNIIKEVKDQKEARAVCRSLNLGSGFAGYTPAFFLQDFKQKERPPTK